MAKQRTKLEIAQETEKVLGLLEEAILLADAGKFPSGLVTIAVKILRELPKPKDFKISTQP